MNADYNRAIKALAKEYQADLSYDKSCHFRLTLPNGRRVTAPGTPSRPTSALKVVRRKLRHAKDGKNSKGA